MPCVPNLNECEAAYWEKIMEREIALLLRD